jgi:hypothetical protein
MDDYDNAAADDDDDDHDNDDYDDDDDNNNNNNNNNNNTAGSKMLRVPHLAKRFPGFCKTHRFSTVFTTARHYHLS